MLPAASVPTWRPRSLVNSQVPKFMPPDIRSRRGLVHPSLWEAERPNPHRGRCGGPRHSLRGFRLAAREIPGVSLPGAAVVEHPPAGERDDVSGAASRRHLGAEAARVACLAVLPFSE